ncbi:MAG: efflux RND transporter periplasmic adaptor subunit [Armatimonadetes bacterium]|nr:efflux RND transporter periplasmic adaptor subunit [Armatimonadota bacterium]
MHATPIQPEHARVTPQVAKNHKRPFKLGRLLWLIGLVALAIGAVVFYQARSAPVAGKMVIGKAVLGDLTETITATGSINAQTGAEVHIGSQITGRIKKLYADVGTQVKAGELIAELDLPDLKAQLDQANAALAQSRMRYQQEVAGVGLTATQTSSGITQAQKAAESAQARLRVAQANLQQQTVGTASDIERAASGLDVANAALNTAQSNLKVVQFNSNLAITNATEQLSQAKANAASSAANEKREKELLAEGFTSQAAYDAAKAQAEVNSSQVRAAEQNVSLTKQKVVLDKQTAENQIAQAKQAVIAAQAALRAAKAETNVISARVADVSDAQANVAQAGAAIQVANAGQANNTIKSQSVMAAADAVKQAEASVAINTAQYAKAFIRTPISGTVLQLATQQGETLAAGISAPTLIIVADLSRLQVDAYVDETDIAKVALGQRVRISVDAFPDKVFEGKVQKIASGSTIQQGVVTYDVTVQIKDTNHSLKPDMTANVTIETGSRSNVLLVPAIAVQASTRGSTVNVVTMKNGNREITPVKVVTGGTDGVNVEIISGLKEGDQVVLAGAASQTKNRGQERQARQVPSRLSVAAAVDQEVAVGDSNASPLLKLREITKLYVMGGQEVHALDGVDMEVFSGEMVAIMGPSGSGKSTLMNVVGCLDAPTSGSYLFEDEEVADLDEVELAHIRNRKIGFVFQGFNLLARTSALENVELPLLYAGVHNRKEQAMAALERVGLGDRISHRSNELSGGQQQRVAIARAIVTNPKLILADEPTGNLSSVQSHEIMTIFQELNNEGATILMVTHEEDIGNHCKRKVQFLDGKIVSDQPIKNRIIAAALPNGRVAAI